MKKERELLRKMQELFAPEVQVFTATVSAVDSASYTVDAIDTNDVEFFNIRLKAAINESPDCLVMIPEKGSDILVGLIGNTDNALYLVQATKLTSLKGKIGETTFEITKDGVVLDGGGNGGFLVSQSVVDDLNSIKTDINNLKTAVTGWSPLAQDGGAALKAALGTWMSQQIEQTNITNVINNRVKH